MCGSILSQLAAWRTRPCPRPRRCRKNTTTTARPISSRSLPAMSTISPLAAASSRHRRRPRRRLRSGDDRTRDGRIEAATAVAVAHAGQRPPPRHAAQAHQVLTLHPQSLGGDHHHRSSSAVAGRPSSSAAAANALELEVEDAERIFILLFIFQAATALLRAPFIQSAEVSDGGVQQRAALASDP